MSKLLISALVPDTVDREEELLWLSCLGEPLLIGGLVSVMLLIGGSVSVMLMIGGELLGASGIGEEADTGLCAVGYVVPGLSMIGPSTQSSVGKIITDTSPSYELWSALNYTNVCIKHQPCFAWTSEHSQARGSKYQAFRYNLSHLVSFCGLSQNTYGIILFIYCPCKNTHCTFKMNGCGHDAQSVEELVCVGIHHQQTCDCATCFDQRHHLRMTQTLDARVVHLHTWQRESWVWLKLTHSFCTIYITEWDSGFNWTPMHPTQATPKLTTRETEHHNILNYTCIYYYIIHIYNFNITM